MDPAPPQDVVDSCVALADAMMSRLEALVAESHRVLVHGDSHPANVVELNGRIVACDLDRISLGPPEADLVIPLSHSRTYPGADPDVGKKLVRTYGRPLNRELLAAAIDVRGIQDGWHGTGLGRTARLGELDPASARSAERGEWFARLHGTERLCPFAA